MALTPTTAGVAASLLPFFDYFRPTKSPYLVVVIVGICGLVAIDFFFQTNYAKRSYWYFAAIPLIIVLIFLTLFVFLHNTEANNKDSEDSFESQLRFSRAICISSGLLCLIVGTWQFAGPKKEILFYVHYISCLWQIVTFVLYTATRLKKSEPKSGLNHFQISLVTASYLVGITACVHLVKGDAIFITFPYESMSHINFYGVSALVFWFLWTGCQVYWTIRLARTIRISVAN